MLDKRVIVALDVKDIEEARNLMDKLGKNVSTFKVGMRMFTKYGPDFVREIIDKGYDVFLDLKYHDIPNTVETACTEAAELGVKMLTVHASGGREMCRAAVKAAKQGARHPSKPPFILAVTVLTSITESHLIEQGIKRSVEDQVLELTRTAVSEGVGGVVCSALEVAKIKSQVEGKFVAVVPGIRLPNNKAGDQKRISGPDSAIRDGADYIVVGRPVYAADDPVQAIREIYSFISGVD